MSRRFISFAALLAVSIVPLAATGTAGAAAGDNTIFFAKLTSDGRGVAIVERKGSKKVCVTVAVRTFSPEEAQIKAGGSKAKIKLDENGQTECDNESGLTKRLEDGDKAQISVKGDGNRSTGKLRASEEK